MTLDRPEQLNAIDLDMAAELAAAWREFRFDDSVRAVVVTGAGERAFCTGLDRGVEVPQPASPYMVDDPLVAIGPKANDLWKPVIAAVNGMACGGAFYLLGEAEFVVADETATFFDPHTTYGMVSAYESVHMAQRMPFGEVARMALMGTAERVSARRAYEMGLVSELTAPGEALAAAVRRATYRLLSDRGGAGHGTGALVGEGGDTDGRARARAASRVDGQSPERGAGGVVHRPPGGVPEPADPPC